MGNNNFFNMIFLNMIFKKKISVKHDVINTVSNNECKSFLNKIFILPALIL